MFAFFCLSPSESRQKRSDAAVKIPPGFCGYQKRWLYLAKILDYYLLLYFPLNKDVPLLQLLLHIKEWMKTRLPTKIAICDDDMIIHIFFAIYHLYKISIKAITKKISFLKKERVRGREKAQWRQRNKRPLQAQQAKGTVVVVVLVVIKKEPDYSFCHYYSSVKLTFFRQRQRRGKRCTIFSFVFASSFFTATFLCTRVCHVFTLPSFCTHTTTAATFLITAIKGNRHIGKVITLHAAYTLELRTVLKNRLLDFLLPILSPFLTPLLLQILWLA